MTITTKLIDGVGRNVRYAVFKDGMRVATVKRNANRGFQALSVPYAEVLCRGATVHDCLAAVQTIDYPSPQQQYDAICARVYAQRLRVLQQAFGPELFRLMTAHTLGSNSAMDEIQKLSEDIEAAAQDRHRSTMIPYEERDKHPAGSAGFYRESCRGVFISTLHTYPAPPQPKEKAA